MCQLRFWMSKKLYFSDFWIASNDSEWDWSRCSSSSSSCRFAVVFPECAPLPPHMMDFSFLFCLSSLRSYSRLQSLITFCALRMQHWCQIKECAVFVMQDQQHYVSANCVCVCVRSLLMVRKRMRWQNVTIIYQILYIHFILCVVFMQLLLCTIKRWLSVFVLCRTNKQIAANMRKKSRVTLCGPGSEFIHCNLNIIACVRMGNWACNQMEQC